MARIDVLPSIEIIRGFKKILDFYVWRGLPCVRAWPTYRPARQTKASLAAALTFGAIVKAYALLANLALQSYREDALDQPRTARDIMVTGVFGNLHEASMSDFLDALIIIRDATIALTDLLHALHTDGSDRLDVDVHASILPPLAATTTNQGLIYGRLGIIDDLADALESNALDRLLVRGEDQHFSVQNTYAVRDADDDSAAGELLLFGGEVPAGQIWVATSIHAHNRVSVNTRIELAAYNDPLWITIKMENNPPAWEGINWHGWFPLFPGWQLIAKFTDCILHDYLDFYPTGFKMTLET